MKKKIIVIEDEKGVRENIIKILVHEGYEAFGSPTGMEGLSLILELKPELIICDII